MRKYENLELLLLDFANALLDQQESGDIDSGKLADQFTKQNCLASNDGSAGVSERYILVEWLNGKPMIDGSTYFDTKEECLEYYNNLPKLAGYDIEYTICRIRNAR